MKLKPQAWSRTNTMTYASGPVMKYDVEGLPEGQKISVANFCPAGREPVWQIGAHIVGQPTEWTGNFKTAKEALAQLQIIVTTPARKEFERTFALNRRPNRVFALLDEANRVLGVRLDWFPHEYACSPVAYFTSDNGETFRHVSRFFGESGVEMLLGDEETQAPTVAALRGLLATWRESFE